MALGDIKILREPSFGGIGSRTFAVAASATTIKAGEPVSRLGTALASVIPSSTSAPILSSEYFVGIAMTLSTNTASAAGSVEVMPFVTGTTYLISPKVAATWDTQAEYDALVGSRVLFDLTSSTYTILAADSTANGLIVEPLDISKYPGKVAFTVRLGALYNA